MIDLQGLMDTIKDVGMQERARYHATFGDLIDKLQKAPDDAKISPSIVGLGAYRGYYSDIALCTERGCEALKSDFEYGEGFDYVTWEKENAVKICLDGTPAQLADRLTEILGYGFDGYKGGFNVITRDKPLWLAPSYGESTGFAIVAITDGLELVTKQID